MRFSLSLRRRESRGGAFSTVTIRTTNSQKFDLTDLHVSKIESSNRVQIALASTPDLYVDGDAFSASDLQMRDDARYGRSLMLRLSTGTHVITGSNIKSVSVDNEPAVYIAHSASDLASGVYGSIQNRSIKVVYAFTSSGREVYLSNRMTIEVEGEDWLGIRFGGNGTPSNWKETTYSAHGGYSAQVGDRMFKVISGSYPYDSTFALQDAYTPQIIIPSTRRS